MNVYVYATKMAKFLNVRNRTTQPEVPEVIPNECLGRTGVGQMVFSYD